MVPGRYDNTYAVLKVLGGYRMVLQFGISKEKAQTYIQNYSCKYGDSLKRRYRLLLIRVEEETIKKGG